MASQIPIQVIGFIGLLGVASHWGYFMHGEFHLAGPALVKTFTVSTLLLFLYLSLIAHSSFIEAAKATILVNSVYLGSLWTSLLVYRGLFHRLCSFPGPPLAKFSKLWYLSQVSNLGERFRSHFSVRFTVEHVVNLTQRLVQTPP